MAPPPAVATSQASKKGGKGGAAGAPRFELTEEQAQEIREAFDLFDSDGTGEAARLLRGRRGGSRLRYTSVGHAHALQHTLPS